jgi:hypothetical protein
MKIVSPEARGDSTGRTRTLTERIKQLKPSSTDLVDGSFLMLLAMIALYGFVTTFDTLHFMLVGALGVLLGVIAAYVVIALRWHWLAVPGLLLVAYFGIGAGVVAREYAFAGFLPSTDALNVLATMVIGGWKEMLTTLPPVVGDGTYLAIPYLLGLLTGAIGFWVARRSRRAAPALAAPLGMLLAVILLGALQTPPALAQGLALAAVGFAWMAVRTRRRRVLAGTGRSQRAALATGTGLVAAALALGGVFGGMLPGGDTTRFVLRSYVQPPVETKDLSSPLVGFRKYSSTTQKKLYDTELLKVDGAPAGSLLRLAVLDDYSGRTWSASGGGTADAGFQRVGARIPTTVTGTPTHITVTFDAAYEQTRELGSWLPSLGENTDITLAGVNVKTHSAAFRYNLDTGQGLLTDGDRFRESDQVSLDSVPVAQGFDATMNPGSGSLVDASSYAFLATTGQKWAGNASTSGERVTQIAARLKDGYWSDGTRTGETQYLPGHSQGRLSSFVLADLLVGSDEQYAATFALLCNQAGYPARVVFGATVPEGGQVAGKDITAWVEVSTDQGWRAIPASVFTPDRNRTPPQQPQTVDKQEQATNVPPPNSTRMQNNTLGLPDNDLSGTKIAGGWLSALIKWLLAVLSVIGPPLATVAAILGAIIAAKLIRRRIRRTRGTPSKQVAGAWTDVFDQCRDLGMVLSADATRLEQSRLIARQPVAEMAVAANTATFGLDDPNPAEVAQLWTQASATRKQLLGELTKTKRFIARFNPRSLLPERLASAEWPKLDFERPDWLRMPGRRAVTPQPGLESTP